MRFVWVEEPPTATFYPFLPCSKDTLFAPRSSTPSCPRLPITFWLWLFLRGLPRKRSRYHASDSRLPGYPPPPPPPPPPPQTASLFPFFLIAVFPCHLVMRFLQGQQLNCPRSFFRLLRFSRIEPFTVQLRSLSSSSVCWSSSDVFLPFLSPRSHL